MRAQGSTVYYIGQEATGRATRYEDAVMGQTDARIHHTGSGEHETAGHPGRGEHKR